MAELRGQARSRRNSSESSASESGGSQQPAESRSELPDLYALLDVEESASAQEIDEAYFRLRQTYSSSNQALYSLINEEEIHASIDEVQRAYSTLSHPQLRARYDSQRSGGQAAKPAAEENKGEQNRRSGASGLGQAERQRSGREEMMGRPLTGQQLPVPRKIIAARALDDDLRSRVDELIAQYEPSDGALFREIRSLLGVSREEMQDHIKISISYIDSLEENRFELLPQSVYVKGFLKSFLRYLGVDACEPLVSAYLDRFNAWTEAKSKIHSKSWS